MPARSGSPTEECAFVPYEELPTGQRRRIVIAASLRTIATITVVVAVYFLIPMDRAITASTVIAMVAAGLALFAVLAWQIRKIMGSEHPGVRAVEALALSIPVYILLFATAYFLMAHEQPGAFGVQQLTRIDGMYFSATAFTTVGFGNIAATSQSARVIVTIQMMLDLVMIGLIVRGVVNAVKIGRQRPTRTPAPGVESMQNGAVDS